MEGVAMDRVVHVFEHSMILSSVISIGHLSTVALAATSIGFMTANVTSLSIIYGLVSTLDTMLPRAWTSDQLHLDRLWMQCMTVVMAVILIPMFVIWLNAEPILLLLRQEPEVAQLAGIYLKWTLLGLLAYAFNCISCPKIYSMGSGTNQIRFHWHPDSNINFLGMCDPWCEATVSANGLNKPT
ncbi:hypothetical protein BDR06DRAFT_1037535 [Suillus hirtellus]|nr:hypothetical protein BDR06DRAFT_1037535 [Suillus hirtellus]